jgi:acyl-CoA synthetase (AMP-forming)/AMP-acid ligase II
VLRTGDLGRFDADGYLSVTGRIKDVIIRGGENLSPGLIEEALAALPGVRACCVVGRADADLGEVPVAVVVRTADAAGAALTAEALQAAVRGRLSRIHVPAAVLFADALPENAVGKVDRKRLARELAQA